MSSDVPRSADIVRRIAALKGLVVYDGRILVGHIQAAGGAFHAFDPDYRLIGVFATQREAVRACGSAPW
jgi:hypothetical protein